MIELKRKYKLMHCSDMQKGDIATVIQSDARSKIGIIIIRTSENFVDLNTGTIHGDIKENVYPTFDVELLEPETELVIK